jgi:hypothetical protein
MQRQNWGEDPNGTQLNTRFSKSFSPDDSSAEANVEGKGFKLMVGAENGAFNDMRSQDLCWNGGFESE